MSTKAYPVLALPLLVILCVAGASAMTETRLDVSIVLAAESDTTLRVTGKFTDDQIANKPELSFVDTYADAESLSERVTGARVITASGATSEARRFGSGIFTVSGPFRGFSYEFDARLPQRLITSPHITWINAESGLIKLADLLPELSNAKITVKLELPAGWEIHTNLKAVGEGVYETNVQDDAVFYVGKAIRTRTVTISGIPVDFSISGDWQFDDEVVSAMTAEILGEYVKLFGAAPGGEVQVNLMQFPAKFENDRWRAETQGSTITIVSSRSTYWNLAEQRLHEQLRHELFHLWIPEALDLEGDYAWFYEGFARYQALRTGVWVGRLGFDDFLRSMSEAINIGASGPPGLTLSEVSENQWLTGPAVTAARGMTLAFMCDLMLLSKSRGKREIGGFIESMFSNNAGKGAKINAAAAIEREFEAREELRSVYAMHVRGAAKIDWRSVTAPFGIAVKSGGDRITLVLDGKPGGRAKALLKKLGYNRWKKLQKRSRSE